MPYTNGNTGQFFIDIDTFKANYLYFTVSYYRPNYIVNYYDRKNDTGTLGHYRFTTTKTQDIHVAGDTYDPRMYAFGCKTSSVMAQLLVRKYQPDPTLPPNPTMGQKYFSDWIGFGHLLFQQVPPGQYEIFIQYSWPLDSAASPNKLV